MATKSAKDPVEAELAEILAEYECRKQEVADARSALNRAECAFSNAETALGAFLVPPKAKLGSEFSVWVPCPTGGRQLLVVRYKPFTGRDYTIELFDPERHGKAGTA